MSLKQYKFDDRLFRGFNAFCRINKEFHNVVLNIYFKDYYYKVLRERLYKRYKVYGKVFDLYYINWYAKGYLLIRLKRDINFHIDCSGKANDVFDDFINYGLNGVMGILEGNVSKYYSAHIVRSFECAFGNREKEDSIPQDIPNLNQRGDNKLDMASWGWDFHSYRDNSGGFGEFEVQYSRNKSRSCLDSVLMQIDNLSDSLFNTSYLRRNKVYGLFEICYTLEINDIKYFNLENNFINLENKKLRYQNYG